MSHAAFVSSATRTGIPAAGGRETSLLRLRICRNTLPALVMALVLSIVSTASSAESQDFMESSPLGTAEFTLSFTHLPLSLALGENRSGATRGKLENRSVLSLSLSEERQSGDVTFETSAKNSSQTKSLLAWSNVQAGYGQVFGVDSAISRGNNVAVWYPPSCVYVKASFTF